MRSEKTDRNQEIADLVAKSELTLEQIGAKHGISWQRVAQIAKRRGIVRGSTMRAAFTDAQLKSAAALVDDGFPVAHAADSVGANRNTLHHALVRSGLYQTWRECQKWSEHDKQVLVENYHKKSVREIANMLGRSRNEVIGAANRLGLCKSKFKPKAAA